MTYGTVVADPPWEYRTRSGILTRAKKHKPEAAAQYPTLTIEQIASLPVESMMAKDAHLYLWVTNPILPVAFDVVRSWGFDYITTLTWRKLGTLGMGYYFRGDTEHVLFGVRGKAPIPPSKRERNWFEAPKRGHSVKPDCLMETIERVSPGPYVELFATRDRPGWLCLGSMSFSFEGVGS